MAIRTTQFYLSVFLVDQTNVNDDIDFSDDVVFTLLISDRQVPEDILAFQQDVFVPSHPHVQQTIIFSQNARSSILNHNIIQRLFLLQHVKPCFGAPWIPIEIDDVINFQQFAGQDFPFILSDNIIFVQDVDFVDSVVGDGHILDLQQSVQAGRGYEIQSQLEFIHNIQSESDFLRVVEHMNVVEQSMTYYMDDPCFIKTYNQFVGEGVGDPIPDQGLLFDSSFVLESIEDGTQLVLRSPETDDQDRLAFNRINRETRGGELNVFSDPEWGKVNTLLFTITALTDGGDCPDIIEQLIQFFLDNLGHEIFLHDWTGISWKGVVTTPDEIAVEDSDGYWTISFEFEGIPQSGSVPQNVISFNHQLIINVELNRALSQSVVFQQAVTVGGDINISVSQELGLVQSVVGEQEITILFDNMSVGSTSVTLDGQSPDIGTNTWRAHTNILDDGTMSSPIDAGAYYRFTPTDGTRYELTFDGAFVTTYNDGDNCIFGFFEDQSSSNSISGPAADGTLNPTAAKAVHLMREVNGSVRNNSYRRGSGSDGTADTVQWTNASLRTSVNSTLDLRIILDTHSAWKATWFAKETIDSDYTEVGPETILLSENISAVGWAQDAVAVEGGVSTAITLKELRSI